jgi:hypothetical protein
MRKGRLASVGGKSAKRRPLTGRIAEGRDLSCGVAAFSAHGGATARPPEALSSEVTRHDLSVCVDAEEDEIDTVARRASPAYRGRDLARSTSEMDRRRRSQGSNAPHRGHLAADSSLRPAA